MEVKKHREDQMTPLERKTAMEEGKDYDRVPCIPFMGELKCIMSGIRIWDAWHDPKKMAEAEIIPYNRYGYDRMVIGPNTRGITEALGGEFVYPENAIPYMETPFLKDYGQLDEMQPVEARKNPRIEPFCEAAGILQEKAAKIVPVETSIGGPFTIASNLRGVEYLLRDCRKCPGNVHRLLRIITDSQKSCIDLAAAYGLGVAMADPVANPGLIGPRMYEKFVYPYTKELTEYALKQTGKKVSLHMCGKTYSIWEYLRKYPLNELSLDNIIDLERAVDELGAYVTIAGNVDPVEIIMNGTTEEITRSVENCIDVGKRAEKGFHLATGCDIPELTAPEKIDVMMRAARDYFRL